MITSVKYSKGIILPVVLSLLMILSLLSLTSYEYAKLQYHIAHAYLIKNEIHSQLLFELKNFEKSYRLDNALCEVDAQDANVYLKQSPAWWRIHGCKLGKKPFRVYYVNEKIAKHVCDNFGDGKTMGLSIHRITLVLLTAHGQSFLQTVEIEPQDNNVACSALVHIHQFGRQGIRWV